MRALWCWLFHRRYHTVLRTRDIWFDCYCMRCKRSWKVSYD